MKCVILHGSKLLPSGSLSSEMQNRIEVLLDLLNSRKYDLLVITGGISGKVQKCESEVIFSQVKDLINIPVRLESDSKTTVQNILKTSKLLEADNIEHLSVITGKTSLRRVKRLYKLYMPQYVNRIEFFGASASRPFKSFVWEAILYVVYLLDPKEYWMRPFINYFRS
jgi:hypothetical protein